MMRRWVKKYDHVTDGSEKGQGSSYDEGWLDDIDLVGKKVVLDT